MSSKVNIIIERSEAGYLVSFPELENEQFQGQSLEGIITRLKETLSIQLESIEPVLTTGQSILNMVNQFSEDAIEDELTNLPSDGAQQHDHYLYGTQKH